VRDGRRPGFGFEQAVAPGGYLWWYADGVSEDQRHAITVIAFVGSVFSPNYAAARRRGPADPLQYCAINVAIYGAEKRRWCFSEYAKTAVSRSPDAITIGNNRVHWDQGTLVFDIDDRTSILGLPVRGSIRLTPSAVTRQPFELDPAGRHQWWPVAPHAQLSVALDRPGLTFRGEGYHDTNLGSEPLEQAFRSWSWSRTPRPDGVWVTYDCKLRDGSAHPRAWRFDQGRGVPVELEQPVHRLPKTLWRLCPSLRAPGSVSVAQVLEDTPFYSRHLLHSQVDGQSALAISESRDLDRFRRRWVQTLLRFRTRRARFHRKALLAAEPTG